VTELLVGELPAASEKPGGVVPVPTSVTVCGLAGVVASSVIVSDPVRKPVVAGANVMLMVQLAPAATLPLQLFDCANSAADVPLVPLAVRLEISKVSLPLLLRVTDCAGAELRGQMSPAVD
jgi:hypothetical protein